MPYSRTPSLSVNNDHSQELNPCHIRTSEPRVR